ncbi:MULTISPECIES: DUF4097 family beta strand repeat-containing protein [unclassified Nocardiopsis]|uniref:DUF4097 family beta strand repeat-containing protein n=1 Tax=Nocardiopsis TaxID=2013 RepID=UPI00387AFB74
MTFKARGLYASSSKEPRSGFRIGPWLVLGGVLVVALIAVTVVSVLGSVGVDRGDRQDSFAAPERVVIENSTGGRVTFTAAEGDEVQVARELRGTPLTEPDEEIEPDDVTLSIEADCTGVWFLGGCSIDYDIAVPAGVEVQVETIGGEVTATGLDSGVEVTTISGAVELTDITGDVRAESTSGRIEAAGISGSADLESTSGRITASGEGERLRAVSTSGEVDVAAFTAGAVEAESVSGSVSVGGGFDTAEVSSVSGSVEVATGDPFQTLAVETTSGSVDIRVPAGSYDVTGESVSGGRDIGVDTSSSGPRVQVDTVSGAVQVRER